MTPQHTEEYHIVNIPMKRWSGARTHDPSIIEQNGAQSSTPLPGPGSTTPRGCLEITSGLTNNDF